MPNDCELFPKDLIKIISNYPIEYQRLQSLKYSKLNESEILEKILNDPK